MSSSTKLLFLLFISLAGISCNRYADDGENIKADEFAKTAMTGDVQVLDVRTIGEFRSGHLKHAMQADWLDQNQFEDRVSYLDKNKPVYVYCMSGARGNEAASYLRQQGFVKVVNLDGGLISWKGAGKTTVECKPHGKQMPREKYDTLITSAPLVLVNFGAQWCPPCKKMDPIVEAFSKESGSGIKVVKMDGGVESGLMQELNVASLPTFILYKNGQEVSRKQKVVNQQELAGWITEGSLVNK